MSAPPPRRPDAFPAWLRNATLLQRFTLVGLFATALCAAAVSVLVSQYEVQNKLDAVAQRAAVTASYSITPTVRASDFGRPTVATIAGWRDRLALVVGSTEIVRVKVFGPDGTLVYSNEPTLIGTRAALVENDELRDALQGRIAKEVGQPNQADNGGQEKFGQLLEVYVPVMEPGSGRVLGAFEVYQRFEPIAAAIRRIQLTVWGVCYLAFGLLFASLFVVVRNASAQLVRMAYHDPLTGAANRHRLHRDIEQAIAASRRSGRPTALLYMDLSRFKAVNDGFGHGAGDEVLGWVARRFQAQVRSTDTLARVGGDEFVVLLAQIKDEEAAVSRAEGLVRAMDEPFEVRGQALHVGVHIGVAMFPEHAETWEDLVTRADTAMYRAKEGGNGVLAYRPEMVRYSRDRLELEEDIRAALAAEEFVVHYQPVFDLTDERVVGAEALTRWNSPKRGAVPPSSFIPLAEETGLIRELDRYVIRRAVHQAAAWSAAGSPLSVAVNVTASTFADAAFPQWLIDTLAQTGLRPGLLTLEITERVLLDADAAKKTLAALSAFGVRIALDDFGTGYSSLAYIQTLPIDVLKIDRCFVQDTGNGGNGQAIVKTIIALAGNLGIPALAEGVELPGQLRWLQSEGCEYVQGYLTGRPMPAEELTRVLADQDGADQDRPVPTPEDRTNSPVGVGSRPSGPTAP